MVSSMASTTARRSSACFPPDVLHPLVPHPHLLSLVAELTNAELRANAARVLAHELGAEDLIVFLPDAELGTLLPAPGFTQTLPNGRQWRQFLGDCKVAEPHRGQLSFPDTTRLAAALGILGECGAVLVLLGGNSQADLATEVAVLLPLLAAAFRGERTAFNAGSSARLAIQSAEQAKLLAGSLDKARAALRTALSTAETANRAKDRFLAALSHELRTPLTPVLLAAASIENDPHLPETVRSEMSMIRRNVELEVQLIDDLLDLSRVIAGKLRLCTAPLDLELQIQHAIDICVPYIREKGIRLHLDLTPGLSVTADATRLQQVMWNLLKNAVKFSPRGEITVRSAAAERGFARVSVSDTGIGIAPGALRRIFDAFEQETVETPREFGGLGLGLAISKAIVDMHGGCIHAASAGPGQGATFTVDLPISDASAATTEPPRHPSHSAPEISAHILLVEDHEDTARTLARLLEKSGHRVKRAGRVSIALQMLDAERFDLLLSDVGLPDRTGHDLMREVAERHQIPGIAMTGYAMDKDVQETRDAGFAEHLVKPVNIQMLKQIIQRILAPPV